MESGIRKGIERHGPRLPPPLHRGELESGKELKGNKLSPSSPNSGRPGIRKGIERVIISQFTIAHRRHFLESGKELKAISLAEPLTETTTSLESGKELKVSSITNRNLKPYLYLESGKELKVF